MATIPQKDVLLEYASGAIALTKDYPLDDLEARSYRREVGALYHKILTTELDDLDYQVELNKIKTLRAKYERID